MLLRDDVPDPMTERKLFGLKVRRGNLIILPCAHE